MSLGAVEGVPQAVLTVLLYMFYDLSALRQVPPLAASKGVLAVVPGDFLRGRWATVTVHWKGTYLHHCCLAKELQAVHSTGTAVSREQCLEGKLCPS